MTQALPEGMAWNATDDSLLVTVRLRRVADGVERDHVADCYGRDVDEAHRAVEFMWTDGNYACDCNRELFFARAAGEDGAPAQDCSHGRFAVVSPSWITDRSVVTPPGAVDDGIGAVTVHEFIPPGPTGIADFIPTPIADRHNLAAIIPLAPRPKPPRSQRWLEAEIHNRRMRQICHYSASPYVEFWEGDRCLGRDPMPTIMLLDDDRALFAMPVEVPGPNCLDAMSEALGLTDAERALFRTRREDAAVLLEEHGNHVRVELERTAPKPKDMTP